MRWSPLRETRVQAAALLAVLGALVWASELWRAVAPVETAAAPSAVFAALEPSRRAGNATDVARLIALAPFATDRTPDSPDHGARETAMADAPGALRLVGTVANGDASFAVCRLGAARPRIVHVRDTVGGWTLEQVVPGKATFIDAARVRHELRLNNAGN